MVCAGTPGIQWLANKYPKQDYQSINLLSDCLKKVQTKKLVLISTISVYPEPINVDEDSIIDESKLSPYGHNRRRLEKLMENNFDTTIVRLPALFGLGLKKNVLYDLINGTRLNKIHTQSTYQFYNLDKLCVDINKAISYDIKVLNIATEPILLKEIIQFCFNYKIDNSVNIVPRMENMLTKFGSYWGNHTDYLYTKRMVFKELAKYINGQKTDNYV